MAGWLYNVAYIIVPFPVFLWGSDRAFKYIGFYALGTVLASKDINEKNQKSGALIDVVAADAIALH